MDDILKIVQALADSTVDFNLDSNDLYVINLDEYADVGMHWIALYVSNNEIT